MFKAAGDTLSRPLPHIYQADAQGNAIPIVPPDEMRQDAVNTMGTAGMHSAVRVQDLAGISHKHVSYHDVLGGICKPAVSAALCNMHWSHQIGHTAVGCAYIFAAHWTIACNPFELQGDRACPPGTDGVQLDVAPDLSPDASSFAPLCLPCAAVCLKRHAYVRLANNM